MALLKKWDERTQYYIALSYLPTFANNKQQALSYAYMLIILVQRYNKNASIVCVRVCVCVCVFVSACVCVCVPEHFVSTYKSIEFASKYCVIY